MGCLKPIPAIKYPSGKVTIKHRRVPGIGLTGEIELPCGTCEACRLVRIRNWAIRGHHESMTNKRMTRHGPVSNGCFVTLTYDEDHVPEDYSLRMSDWQNFMKALRRRFKQKIRYLACGEYGPVGGRPHMHGCLYGIDFHEDRVLCENSTAKETSVEWTSEALSTVWRQGTATLGPLTYATAAYTAGYVLKKQSGQQHLEDHAIYGASSEPLELRKQEWNTMSTKPGLGRDWFEKYWSDVYPKDSVEIEGKTFRPPAYYDQLLFRRDPAMHAEVLQKRLDFTKERGLTSPQQLRARGAIFAALQKQKNQTERGDL